MQKAFVPTHVNGYQIETLDGEIVLFHPARNIIVHGNQTSALIWHLCDGVRTVGEIVAILSAAYPEAGQKIQVDVPETIQALVSQGALESR
jgi:Coenzyme PQQ synthesis protein D (PqqD)